MLRKRVSAINIQPLFLLPKDRKTCGWISNYVIIQCIVIFIGAISILFCVWSPKYAFIEHDKLIRIMYLYDPRACGYHLHSSGAIADLQLSNDTHGLNVLPIKWKPAIAQVATRFSAKTRRYIKLSIAVHAIWMLSAIALQIFRSTKTIFILKVVLLIFFYISAFVIFFDVSMAIVYIAHIQQSLTKGMIVRYSGWGVEMHVKNYNDFGGWFPMFASACWLRGIVFLALNIYCCRLIRLIRKRIRKSEVKTRLMMRENPPIPEASYKEPRDSTVLYYRAGEYKPVVKRTDRFSFML